MNRLQPPSTQLNRAARRALARRARRRGQALILAVLVMLMIAVVSAGFLVVVSGNLNQTARLGDKTRAVEAARSGLRFVNERLTFSPLGENWRPGFVPVDYENLSLAEKDRLNQGESLIPKAGDAQFNLVYSPVERANGWAGVFAKFPDPLAPPTDAPQYLARVQRIPGELDAGDVDATDPTKNGALKITVIGLSPDDPSVFHKSIAYKGGQSAPLGRFMRTVGNWDWKNKVVPSATASYDNTSQVLSMPKDEMKGTFPPVPFSVMVGNAGGADLQSAVVDSVVVLPLEIRLHLASDPFGKTLSGVRVELAAQLGSSLPVGIAGTESAVDFNANGAVDAGENTQLEISSSGAGSARVNGGLSLTGGVFLPGLDKDTGKTVRVSGLLVQRALTANSKATVSKSGAPTPFDLASGSNDPTFPGTGISTDLVADGSDRLSGDATGERVVAPFSPPDFSSGAGASRYRALTRDSRSLVLAQPDAANYGQGDGLYINNPSDRERVFDTATNKLRDLTHAELLKLWLSRTSIGAEDTSAKFNRAGTPASAAALDASLEEQHLRGWVGPDEFRARGALVELFNDASDGGKAKLAVTLDARSDNSTAGPNNALGPVAAKAWRDASGTIQPGVYRRVFPWPANGVVFAEGNLRVRGEVTNAPRSLTLVSQNNIYTDGSLGADTKKILLLARKNVVANPTAAVFRPDVQSVATQDATLTAGTATDVEVADASDFKAGDVIESAAPTTPTTIETVSVVQAVVDATTLTVLPLKAGTLSATQGDIVRTRRDAVQNGRPVLASSFDAIQRRLQVSSGANVRLAFAHNADRVSAATIETEDAGGFSKPTSPFAFLSHKKASAATIVAAEKRVQGDFLLPAPGSDFFPNAVHSTEVDAQGYDLAALKTAMENTAHVADPIGWKYKVTLAGAATTPAFYLAGVGNRGDFGAPVVATPDFRKDISGAAYEVPLATSVQTLINGAPTTLRPFDAPASNAMTFGFGPLYLASEEDVATADQSFYQGTTTAGVPDAATQNATLDSREIAGAVAGQKSLVLRPGTGLVAGITLPTYRSSDFRLENVASTGEIKPGFTMNINAFVYAQTGSWFVIPAAPVEPLAQNLKLRGDQTKSYFDFNANGTADAGEFVDTNTIGTFDAGDGADLNRNGASDTGEAQAFLRWTRANYRLNFVGAIAENQTALVDAAGAFPGAVAAWSNSWASYELASGAFADQVAGVKYSFDPSYANGSLFGDAGFVMPQSDELTYVE